MKAQETTHYGAKKRFKRIKQAADSVDITGMSRDEADTERMYAALGLNYKKPKRLQKIKNNATM